MNETEDKELSAVTQYSGLPNRQVNDQEKIIWKDFCKHIAIALARIGARFLEGKVSLLEAERDKLNAEAEKARAEANRMNAQVRELAMKMDAEKSKALRPVAPDQVDSRLVQDATAQLSEKVRAAQLKYGITLKAIPPRK